MSSNVFSYAPSAPAVAVPGALAIVTEAVSKGEKFVTLVGSLGY